MSGKVIRRMTGPVDRGMHRVTWDLRGFSATVAGEGGGRGGRGGGGGGAPIDEEGGGPLNAGGGHFVPAGKYKVAIAKRVEGKTTTLASVQTFEVINDGGAPPVDFLEKVTRLQGAVTGAVEAATTTKQRLTVIKRALEESASDPKLMEERNTLDRRLDALLVTLSGDTALRSRRENLPSSLSQRANGVANETRGLLEPPTKTQQDQYSIAAAELEQLLPKLRTLVETDLKKFAGGASAARHGGTANHLLRRSRSGRNFAPRDSQRQLDDSVNNDRIRQVWVSLCQPSVWQRMAGRILFCTIVRDSARAAGDIHVMMDREIHRRACGRDWRSEVASEVLNPIGAVARVDPHSFFGNCERKVSKNARLEASRYPYLIVLH